MMYSILKTLQALPVTLITCEMFLLDTALLAVIGKITIDDWTYLAHLVTYRAQEKFSASDERKEEMRVFMQRMEKQKNELKERNRFRNALN